MKEKVLVTGACGFIGSHLVEELVRSGYEVRALTYYNSFGHKGWLDQLPADVLNSIDWVAGDIRDPNQMDELVKGCDFVCHLAALIAIPFSYVAPDSYVETNISGTLNLLNACRRHGIKRFLQTSTSEVYGTAQFVPITEEHPLSGQSPYSATKIGSDQIALSFYKSFSTPVAVVRPFNTYGPRQSARAVIPTVALQVLQGKTKIELGSLTPTRDFNFVKDTCRGFVAALRTNGAIEGEVINLASEFEVSIGETASLIAEVLGKDIQIVEDPRRKRPEKSEVERLFGSRAKAEKLLDWRPEYGEKSGFKKGLEETITWFSDSKNLSRYAKEDYAV